MRWLLAAFFAQVVATEAVPSTHPTPDLLQGVRGIVQRRIPNHVNDFTFKLVNGSGDEFGISDTERRTGGITVSCTSVNACARGLYTYVFHSLPRPQLLKSDHPDI